MELTILGSGSKGNAAALEMNGRSILIDAGFSYRALKNRLLHGNIPVESVSGILVSHEHFDHIRGLGVISRVHSIPVYTTKKTFMGFRDEIKKDTKNLVRFIDQGKTFELNGMKIKCFPVKHDAADPVGFTFSSNGHKIGFVTDIGSITDVVINNLKDSNVLVLEANHDKDMLWNSNYPHFLKERIGGSRGHLSNTDTFQLLKRVMHENLKAVYLSHLSKENNSPSVAKKAIHNQLAHSFNYVPEIKIAWQDGISEPYTL
jgi:phosphoribosyl 1,2-cyclic phosphodiesterase